MDKNSPASIRGQLKLLAGLLVVAVLGYGAWLAIRAHRNLVTLNVRNMDVRKVVKKIEWQTWESISVDKEVQGKVTLRVRKVPLEVALQIIADQTSSRWSTLYPLYSGRPSLELLKRGLRGEIEPADHGWTNWQSRPFFRGGPMGGGPFGGPNNAPSQFVSLQLVNKDVEFAALAFNRFAQVRIVPQDGTAANINLILNQVSVSKAVAQLAKAVSRKWTQLYVLQAQFGPGGPGGPGGFGGPPQLASRETNSADQPGPRRPEFTPEEFEEMRKKREAQEQELRQALPEAERQRLEAEQKKREAEFAEMQNLTPEQRRERFAQRGGPNMTQRQKEMLRNTTPEQRAEMNRRMQQMRQRMQQMGPRQPGAGQPQQGPAPAR